MRDHGTFPGSLLGTGHDGRNRGSALRAVTTRRADRERRVAEEERRLADAERPRAGHSGRNEREHYRAMRAHERSAELHDAIAELLPGEGSTSLSGVRCS